MPKDSIFVRKAVYASATEGLKLRRALGLWDLIFLGIGSIMGTGVFVLTGKAAVHAGPGVMLSFVVAALCAGLSAMCYAEMAGMLPISGSAYLYAYATLGEVVAFVLGWALSLMYIIGAATLGVGWSGYGTSLLQTLFHARLPEELCQSPIAFDVTTQSFYSTQSVGNLPAAAIILAVAALLQRGVTLSARMTAAMVVIKIAVVVIFIACAWPRVDPAHWQPLVPENRGTFGDLGTSGVLHGAMLLFFAYMGFDAISAAAAECKRPARDMPVSILVSLSACALLYVGVAATLTGLMPYAALNVPYPMALAAHTVGSRGLATLVEAGAAIGLTSVLLAQLYVQPRIIMAMAHDRLLPHGLTHVHPMTQVPHRLTWGTAAIAAMAAMLLPVDALAELTSVGILLIFAVVALGVCVQRLRDPHRARSFRVPGGPYVIPGLAWVTCCGLMACASRQAMMQLTAWMVIGLAVYLGYGRNRAQEHRRGQKQVSASGESPLASSIEARVQR